MPPITGKRNESVTQPVKSIIAHPYTPERLLRWGTERADAFCAANKIRPMRVLQIPKEQWKVSACAYWRDYTCRICLEECARPATASQVRNWSWPGTVTDRTPYGVVCHELGHHCDYVMGVRHKLTCFDYSSAYGECVMKASGEKPITSYCPNPAEWFAEMMRLFITNHALLAQIRPKTWDILTDEFIPVSDPDWEVCLGKGCPERIKDRQLKR